MRLIIIILISLTFLLGKYSNSTAQEKSYSGNLLLNTKKNEQSYKYLRVEYGNVKIYEEKNSGSFFAIRFVKSVTRGNRVRMDFGLVTAAASEGFRIADAGMEWLILPHALFSPYIGGGAGIIKDDIFYGLVYRWSAGISLRMGKSSLRFTMQRGTQIGGITSFSKGDDGPNFVGVGVDLGI